jgi:hypothetical protein
MRNKVDINKIRTVKVLGKEACLINDLTKLTGSGAESYLRKHKLYFKARAKADNLSKIRTMVWVEEVEKYNKLCDEMDNSLVVEDDVEIVFPATAGDIEIGLDNMLQEVQNTPVADLPDASQARSIPNVLVAKLNATRFDEGAANAEITHLVKTATKEKARKLGITNENSADYGEIRKNVYIDLYKAFDEAMTEALAEQGLTLWGVGLGRGNNKHYLGNNRPAYGVIISRAGYAKEYLVIARAFFKQLAAV